MTSYPIFSDISVCISEFKTNPMAIIQKVGSEPVAVLSKDGPIFYAVPAKTYEALIDYLDDIELTEIVKLRLDNPEYEAEFKRD